MAESVGNVGTEPADVVFGEVKRNWGWMLALGILFIILGTIGLGMSFTLTIVSVLFFGWLAIIGGVLQLVEAFKAKGWKSILWYVLMAVVYVVAGAIMVYDPAGSAIALTIFIAAALFAVGVLRIIMAFEIRGTQGWWWPLVGGVISILLGVMIMSEWPATGLWVIGMFVAIELIVNGWSYVMIAMAARQAAKAETEMTTGAATA